MSTVAVELPDDLLSYVEDRISSGRSTDRSRVMQRALRIMRAIESRQSAFQAAIQEGLDAEAAGDFEVVDDLEAWFADLRKDWA